jgi:hypothetical protein
MSKVTFDLLDAPLGDVYGYIQGLPDSVRISNYQQSFLIDPQKWEQHMPDDWVFGLNWREYRYADIQKSKDLKAIIPENDPGIYIFYTRANRLVYQFPRFAFYIGISNEHNSQRPLRERLKDYLPTAISAIRKRENIHRMLQFYYQYIWVAFALTSVSSTELSNVEERLHGFIYPCFCRRDFPTDIKKQQQAFGGI